MKLTSDNPTSEEFLPILNELDETDPDTLDLLMEFALLNTEWIQEKLYADIDPDELNKSLNKLEEYWIIKRDVQKKILIISIGIQAKIRELIDW